MTSKPVRHFVTLGQRQLHLRMAGRGSPVLMLHRAPTSSVSLESLILEASGFATVIALTLTSIALARMGVRSIRRSLLRTLAVAALAAGLSMLAGWLLDP